MMTDAKILIVDDMQENLILLDFALRPLIDSEIAFRVESG